MSQSLSRVLVHLVFSTKHREALIAEAILPKLHGYLTGILKNLDCPSLRTGGASDHVHLLLVMNRTMALAQLVQELKTSSSKWMKGEGESPTFSWQAGYGAFSVSESKVEAVKSYIANQEEHHRRVTFQDEYRALLEKHRVPFDERYVWD